MELKEAKEVLNKNGYCLIDESGVGDLTDIILTNHKLKDELDKRRKPILSEIEKLEDEQNDLFKEIVNDTLKPFLDKRNIGFYFGSGGFNNTYFGLKDNTSKLYQQSICYVYFDEDTEKFVINQYHKDQNVVDVRHPVTGNFVKMKFTKNKKFKSTPPELQKIYFNVANALYEILEIKIPIKENEKYNEYEKEIYNLRLKVRSIENEYPKGIRDSF